MGERAREGHAADGDAPDVCPSAPRVRTPIIPVAFLGLGVYRAWIEIAFVGSFVDYPALPGFAARDVFDLVMVVTALLCSVFAHQLGPLYRKRGLQVGVVVGMVLAGAGMFASCVWPDLAQPLGWVSSVVGGVSIALMILLWSELYGCLNPVRVVLYYSSSLVAGALIIYVYRGFMFPWLFVMTALLPVASLICARRAFAAIPPDELPPDQAVRVKVPWKAVLLMAVYAFVYGMMENGLYAGGFGPHSALGMVAMAVIVVIMVSMRGQKLDMVILYRIALPLMIVALFLLSTLDILGGFISSLAVSAGYAAQSIIIMLICANLCYRYRVSAVWLFGIERGVRQIAMVAGRGVTGWLRTSDTFGSMGDVLVVLLAVIALVVATMLVMSERDLSSDWGAVLSSGERPQDAVRERTIGEVCAEVGREYGLSAREGEVLLLLAQRKTVATIEHELLIANGTAKAHVRHIYAKLDIHTRDELFERLGLPASGASAEE